MDLLIIVDREYIDTLYKCTYDLTIHLPTLHGLGTIMYNRSINHTYLYDDYYHGHTKNPLISWLLYNNLPDLENLEIAENINYLKR